MPALGFQLSLAPERMKLTILATRLHTHAQAHTCARACAHVPLPLPTVHVSAHFPCSSKYYQAFLFCPCSRWAVAICGASVLVSLQFSSGSRALPGAPFPSHTWSTAGGKGEDCYHQPTHGSFCLCKRRPVHQSPVPETIDHSFTGINEASPCLWRGD